MGFNKKGFKVKDINEINSRTTSAIFENIKNMQKFQEEFKKEIKIEKENKTIVEKNEIIAKKNIEIVELKKYIDRLQYFIFCTFKYILRAILIFYIYIKFWT